MRVKSHKSQSPEGQEARVTEPVTHQALGDDGTFQHIKNGMPGLEAYVDAVALASRRAAFRSSVSTLMRRAGGKREHDVERPRVGQRVAILPQTSLRKERA